MSILAKIFNWLDFLSSVYLYIMIFIIMEFALLSWRRLKLHHITSCTVNVEHVVTLVAMYMWAKVGENIKEHQEKLLVHPWCSCSFSEHYSPDTLIISPVWPLNAAVPSGCGSLEKCGQDFGHADGWPDSKKPAALCQPDNCIGSRWDNHTAVTHKV